MLPVIFKLVTFVSYYYLAPANTVAVSKMQHAACTRNVVAHLIYPMKHLLITIFLFSISCQRSPGENENLQSRTNDSIEVALSQETKKEATDVEQKQNFRNQTFMEFFSHFMWDKEFQKSRVKFPININGQEIKNQSDWEHNTFYTSKSFIPILHSDTLTYYDKDIADEEVKMSIISFKNSKIEEYYFLNEKSEWKLLEIKTQSIDSLFDVDFINFLTRFSSDSIYQIEHVQFPLPNYYADYDNDYETTYDSISINNWRHWDLTESLEGLMSLNLKTGSPYRKIFFRGIENGIHVHYTFIKSGDSWKLIKLEDYST